MRLCDMNLSEKVLTELHACESAIKFCKRNNLFGFPMTRLNEVVGDYMGYIGWLREYGWCEFNEREQKTAHILSNGFRVDYEYDERGNRVKTVYQDKSVDAFYYNDQGLLIRMELRHGRIELYDYNNQGKMIKKTVPGVYTEECVYDERGNIIGKFNSQGDCFYWHYLYDSNGKVLEESSGNSTKLIVVFINRYDKSGNLIYSKCMSGTPLL